VSGWGHLLHRVISAGPCATHWPFAFQINLRSSPTLLPSPWVHATTSPSRPHRPRHAPKSLVNALNGTSTSTLAACPGTLIRYEFSVVPRLSAYSISYLRRSLHEPRRRVTCSVTGYAETPSVGTGAEAGITGAWGAVLGAVCCGVGCGGGVGGGAGGEFACCVGGGARHTAGRSPNGCAQSSQSSLHAVPPLRQSKHAPRQGAHPS